ncbi:MAG TPA: hypothetical protein VGB14_13295 [Acidimicrobiales bacterium]|jgi:hypothetical protein
MSLGSGPGFVERLERWAAEARVTEAASARARERWLRQQAGEDATVVGTLVDLAEREATVVVRTREGRRHRGRVTAVAADFVVVAPDTGGVVLVAARSLATFSEAGPGGGRPAGGDRPPAVDVTLAVALAGLAAERPAVAVVAAGVGEPVRGDLVGVGVDLLTVRPDGAPRSPVHVPVAAVAEVAVLDDV